MARGRRKKIAAGTYLVRAMVCDEIGVAWYLRPLL